MEKENKDSLQTVQQPAATPKSGNGKKLLRNIAVTCSLVILALLIGVGGGFILHMKTEKFPLIVFNTTPTPTVTPTPTETPKPAKTLPVVVSATPTPTKTAATPSPSPFSYAGWKEYTSEDLKLTFKYDKMNKITYKPNQYTLVIENEDTDTKGHVVLLISDLDKYYYPTVTPSVTPTADLIVPGGNYVSLDTNERFAGMAEDFANPATVKINGTQFYLRHMLYGDGVVGPEETCVVHDFGFSDLYTEYRNQVYSPLNQRFLALDIRTTILGPNDKCVGEQPIQKQQKQLIEEAKKILESMKFLQ